jgi:hypothetical protein
VLVPQLLLEDRSCLSGRNRLRPLLRCRLRKSQPDPVQAVALHGQAFSGPVPSWHQLLWCLSRALLAGRAADCRHS